MMEREVLKSIDDLSGEQIVGYLFSSNLPDSIKKLISEEVNKYDTNSGKITDLKKAFSLENMIDTSYLDVDFCPVELKKMIIDEVYGADLLGVILSDSISFERKKVIIDLRCDFEKAIELLNSEISDDIKSYVIDNAITDYNAILFCLKNDDISDDIKEKIIIRKITLDNLFQFIEDVSFSVKNLIIRTKRRDIDDFINSLDSSNILKTITNYVVVRNFLDNILRSRYSVIEDAISVCSKADLFKVIRVCDNCKLNEIIMHDRESSLLEIINESDPNRLLVLLSLTNLSNDIKEYIINYHSNRLNSFINDTDFSLPKKYFKNSNHLPLQIKRKLFEKYKDEFVRDFNELSNNTVICEILYGSYDDFYLGLLIDTKIDESNIFELLGNYSIQPHIIDLLFDRKADLLKRIVNNLDLVDILTLNNLKFDDTLKNRILDVSSDVVLSKLSNIDNERLFNYLKSDKVLISVKKRIMEHFGIFEADLQNCLEIFDFNSAELLINHYKEIKHFITIAGVDFHSFLRYGSGSSKYPNWLVDLIKIIEDNRVSDFISVKNYFYNNYFNRFDVKENDVCNISNFLFLLGNFYRYNELCMNLANNNIKLSDNDKLDIQFLFNLGSFDSLDIPKNLDEVVLFKQKLYGDMCKKVHECSDINELKNIFNKLLFCNSNVILESIGGTECLKKLRIENSNSDGIKVLIDELLAYSKIIEMVNDTNNYDGLVEMLDFVFSDVETLTVFQNVFSLFEQKVSILYEADIVNHLTSLEKVKDISGVINRNLSLAYGGTVYDFSDKNYVLYAHTFSVNEKIEDLISGVASGKRNFISVSPISYKGQKYYWDFNEVIFAFDHIPRGSFVCSSIYNMGTNQKLRSNSSEVEQFSRTQRGILETSAVFDNNSETLLFAEGLKPCGLILPGGRKPLPIEMEYHEKYNLPFIITQDIGKSIVNPQRVFSNNDCNIMTNKNYTNLLNDLISILEPNVELKKEDSLYTGREVAIFADGHSMYEPTVAVLEDMRRRGISEIYSLGDNFGGGPNPVEVFDLLDEYGVVSIAGNGEYYNTLGLESFPYMQGERVEGQNWTKEKLGNLRIEKLKVYPASIELIVGGEKLALCHFANDIRWDFIDNSVWKYRSDYSVGNAPEQFLYTNSDASLRKIDAVLEKKDSEDLSIRGYVSAKQNPLFDGKRVTDYRAIIQGHVHFDMKDKLFDTDIYTLRAVGMGYEDDYNDTACYYVLKEKKSGGFDIEKRLVTFNRNNLIANIYTSDLPEKGRVLQYLNGGRDRVNEF